MQTWFKVINFLHDCNKLNNRQHLIHITGYKVRWGIILFLFSLFDPPHVIWTYFLYYWVQSLCQGAFGSYVGWIKSSASAYKRWCSVRLYLQLFVGELWYYLRCLCLFTYSGVQHILCYMLCILCCHFFWIVHFWLALR